MSAPDRAAHTRATATHGAGIPAASELGKASCLSHTHLDRNHTVARWGRGGRSLAHRDQAGADAFPDATAIAPVGRRVSKTTSCSQSGRGCSVIACRPVRPPGQHCGALRTSIVRVRPGLAGSPAAQCTCRTLETGSVREFGLGYLPKYGPRAHSARTEPARTDPPAHPPGNGPASRRGTTGRPRSRWAAGHRHLLRRHREPGLALSQSLQSQNDCVTEMQPLEWSSSCSSRMYRPESWNCIAE